MKKRIDYKNSKLLDVYEPLCYGYQESHKYIQHCFGENYNIDERGNNLTIMVLSQNRSGSTKDLLDSIQGCIPDFEGEILIVDNNSHKDEKKIVKDILSAIPFKSRFVELDQNYGVAGGRNRDVTLANTLWIMSMNNDVLFIDNPLPEIFNTIEAIVCHFLNLRFLNSSMDRIIGNGDALYIEKRDNEVYYGQESMFIQETGKRGDIFNPSLGTFLFGIVSLFRKDTFPSLGGFDEGMFVRFEDTNFSLTLF